MHILLLQWFNGLQTGRTLTVRDLLSWVTFVNVINESLGPAYAILHGAFLVLLDGLSLGRSFPIFEIFCIVVKFDCYTQLLLWYFLSLGVDYIGIASSLAEFEWQCFNIS